MPPPPSPAYSSDPLPDDLRRARGSIEEYIRLSQSIRRCLHSLEPGWVDKLVAAVTRLGQVIREDDGVVWGVLQELNDANVERGEIRWQKHRQPNASIIAKNHARALIEEVWRTAADADPQLAGMRLDEFPGGFGEYHAVVVRTKVMDVLTALGVGHEGTVADLDGLCALVDQEFSRAARERRRQEALLRAQGQALTPALAAVPDDPVTPNVVVAGSAAAPMHPAEKMPPSPDDSCPVVLPGLDEKVLVLGREKNPLPSRAYKAVRALVDVFPEGLSGSELDHRSGVADARKELQKLAGSDGDWKAVINFPKRGWSNGYSLTDPEAQNAQNSPRK